MRLIILVDLNTSVIANREAVRQSKGDTRERHFAKTGGSPRPKALDKFSLRYERSLKVAL